MTLIIPRTFKLQSEHRLASNDAVEVSLQDLRDIVTGKDLRFSRSQAMLLLQNSDAPDKHLEFDSVLKNEKEVSELRYQAALHLGRLNTKDALASLIRNSNSRDQEILSGVVKALGWIGDETALPALEKVIESKSGFVTEMARFSAALIAHRNGVAGHNLPIPDEKQNLRLPVRSVAAMLLAAADPKELEVCLRSIGGQTFGINLDEKRAYSLICNKRRMMVLFNSRLITPKGTLDPGKRKTFPGLIATYVHENQSYGVAYLMLSSPTGKGDAVNLLITRTNGDIVFTGKATPAGEVHSFDLSATPRPGAHAIRIKGSLNRGQLNFSEAESSLKVQVAKRVPARLVRVKRIAPVK